MGLPVTATLDSFLSKYLSPSLAYATPNMVDGFLAWVRDDIGASEYRNNPTGDRSIVAADFLPFSAFSPLPSCTEESYSHRNCLSCSSITPTHNVIKSINSINSIQFNSNNPSNSNNTMNATNDTNDRVSWVVLREPWTDDCIAQSNKPT